MPVPVDVIRFAFWMDRFIKRKQLHEIRKRSILQWTIAAKFKIRMTCIDILASILRVSFLHVSGELP